MPALAARLFFQIGASVAATLVASAIVTSLPRSGGSDVVSTAELTSGGKFAARIVEAGEGDVQAAAATTLLPIMSMMPDLPLAAASTAEARPAEPVSTVDLVKPTDGKGVRTRTRSASKSERPRLIDAALPATARPGLVAVADPPREPDGIWSTMTSSARSAWSTTTSAGGTLLSHLSPW